MPTDEKLAAELAALGHPTRLLIVRLLIEAHELSPREASARQDVATLGALAHHFRVLHRASLIEQTRTRRVRGAIEHFYVLTNRGRELAAALLTDGR